MERVLSSRFPIIEIELTAKTPEEVEHTLRDAHGKLEIKVNTIPLG